jgi:hypothetical protein
MGARFIVWLIVACVVFGTAWGGALLNATMGPWTAWGVNHDGTTTHMAFGQNLPRPDFIVLYPGAFVVQGSLLTSPAMPSGVGKLDIGTRAGFSEVRDFYLARLADAGFDVVDRGIGPLNPATAAYLGIAGSLEATRAATGDFITVVIRTPDGIIASRVVELSWRKIGEMPLRADGSTAGP